MRVAVLTTSDIQNTFPPRGKPKVVVWQSVDGDTVMYTAHNLERAQAMKATGEVSRIVVVSTRHNPYNSDEWWMPLVDAVYWCCSEDDDSDSSAGWKNFWEDEGMIWPTYEGGHLDGKPYHWTSAQHLLRKDADLKKVYMLPPF